VKFPDSLTRDVQLQVSTNVTLCERLQSKLPG